MLITYSIISQVVNKAIPEQTKFNAFELCLAYIVLPLGHNLGVFVFYFFRDMNEALWRR